MSGADGPSAGDNSPISGYVDIHAHLLPGIDDGPPDLDQSLEMARSAVRSGISNIVATPHLRMDFPDVSVRELSERCTVLQQAIGATGILLEVLPGTEASLGWALEATDEELVLASFGQCGNDLLIEAPFTRVANLDRLLASVQKKGYRVTLAHPERSPQFLRDAASLRPILDQGILLQINAESLLGSPARNRSDRLAERLLVEGVAHVIASDAHRGEAWRPITALAEAVHAASRLIGEPGARWLTEIAPRAIMSGARLPSPPPNERRPRFRRKLRRN